MFSHLLTLSPLGLLYGSAGPFLSPENLVGRSGDRFPPSAATVSGLYAAHYGSDEMRGKKTLQIAGPFLANEDEIANANIYVPQPLTLLRPKDNSPPLRRTFCRYCQQWNSPPGKYEECGWIAIADWDSDTPAIEDDPWEFLPHLHPKLQLDQRKTVDADGLFLENAVQLHPDVCLVYLVTHEIPDGWYRFGGEGHMVDLTCHELDQKSQLAHLLAQPLGSCFATVTPAVWGSNRCSLRFPPVTHAQPPSNPATAGDRSAKVPPPFVSLLCDRPIPVRHRFGGGSSTKRLARGRYAVPAGAVYILEEGEGLPPWHQWDSAWFPHEAFSFQRFGNGLALPLNPTQVFA